MLNQRIYDEHLRRNFLAFGRKCFETIFPGETLLPNWHMGAIACFLEDVEKGLCKRAIINLPPRTMKSVLVSIAWVAWRLGHEPNLKIICASYSSDLSSELASQFRQIVSSGWYRRVFPAMRTALDTKEEVKTTAGGYRLAASVGGSILGRGANLVVIDDVMKAEEATSEAARNRAYHWATGTVISRLDNKAQGAVVVVMQRLHEDDLCGRLLDGNASYRLLKVPAIATEDERYRIGPNSYYDRAAGEPLHAEWESLETLEELREEVGAAKWAAMYQQDPTPSTGLFFSIEKFQTYQTPSSGGRVVQAWDCASKAGVSNDWSVCVTARVSPRRVEILDVTRGKFTFPQLKRRTLELAEEYRPNFLLIEDKASGTPLLQQLEEEPGLRIRATAADASDSKEVRADSITPIIDRGEVYLPEEAHWKDAFVKELAGFPNRKHDDQVDAFVHLLRHFQSHRPRVSVMPFLAEKETTWSDVGRFDPGYSDPYDHALDF